MTAGSRMFWWNKRNPLTTFIDKRHESFTMTYHNKNRAPFTKTVAIEPDVQCDWAASTLPFADNTFSLVVFDPPHLIHAGPNSWLAKKYGLLDINTWQADLKHGMDEAMRVVKPQGTIVFKWNDDQIKLPEVLAAIDREPLFGDKKAKTHWLVFMKI